ncbi:MAG: hypothetical protein IIA63_05710 [Nitrospinae bacterium]|nr:hypothetical protein [Nitrospinota bacterium]
MLAALVFSGLCASNVWADADDEELEDPFEGKPPLADQIREFSNEIARRFHQELQNLLDKELKVLREERKKSRYTAEERIAKQEGIIKDDPKNAEAHLPWVKYMMKQEPAPTPSSTLRLRSSYSRNIRMSKAWPMPGATCDGILRNTGTSRKILC